MNRAQTGRVRTTHHFATDGWKRASYAPYLVILAILGTGWRGFALGASESQTSAQEGAAFDLKEIPAFEAPDRVRNRFLTGAYAECRNEPDQDVKRYPAFKSDKPLYGSFQIGGVYTEPKAGYHYACALDESAGTGCGYDRIYIDVNLNGDLTDDRCCLPMKDVPEKALVAIKGLNAQVCFETVTLRVTPADDPQRRLEVMPRFIAYPNGPKYAMFMSTKAHVGVIKVGEVEIYAVLGHASGIPGWFDHPATGLLLFEDGRPDGRPLSLWYWGGQLKSMHRKGDTYYCFSATPDGDRLFVSPYRGPLGTLEIKLGERDVRRVSLSGSLGSKNLAISLTETLGQRIASADSYRLPVGDYGPLLLNFSYDTLSCMVLRNIHADGLARGRPQTDPGVCPIQIREDRPFVLDLSSRPQVLFASPGKDHRVARGGLLEVKAVLIDPSLDIMFRSIRQQKQLDPRVAIKRANGEIVAEGVMPFG